MMAVNCENKRQFLQKLIESRVKNHPSLALDHGARKIALNSINCIWVACRASQISGRISLFGINIEKWSFETHFNKL